MPYTVAKNEEGKHCVYRADADGKPFGESFGCHDEPEEAYAQIAAIEAREKREVKHGTVKAIWGGDEAGEWKLEVLGNPYGSPTDLDTDGEYFSASTSFHDDKWPAPPAVYYHGYTPDGQPNGRPEYIGKTINREARQDGVWYTVILDKTKELARRVWDAALQGLARASTGSVSHLVRVGPDGHILEWPVAELSLMDMGEGRQPANRYAVAMPVLKAIYTEAGVPFPFDAETDSASGTGVSAQRPPVEGSKEGKRSIERHKEVTKHMSEETTNGLTAEDVAAIVMAQLKADREAQEAEANARAERETELAEAHKAGKEEGRTEFAEEIKAGGRLAFTPDTAPVVGRFGELRRYDNLDAGDTAFMIETLRAHGAPVREEAYKALAWKLNEDETDVGHAGIKAAIKAGMPVDKDGIKANEVGYSTLASYGDEWVVTANSTQLWEQVRHEAVVTSKIPQMEIPPGIGESVLIPLESTDPVFYKVAQVASDAASTGLSTPAPTVTSSRLGTANNTISLVKMGARVRWSGELEEDSIVPFVPQLRSQITTVGGEYLDHVVIDGHTAATASTNYNDIGGTPSGYEAYILLNGMRYVALATSGRYRSGGALDEDDFVETMKLLGPAGDGYDPDKCAFLVSSPTHFKMLMEITALKTRDVYPGAPTIESGRITQIWGCPVIDAKHMGYVYKYSPHTMTGYEKKFDTAGKINQDTASNNTTGLILLVRWDRWKFGWRRRMTMETVRHPEWDGTEITALMRFGLLYRDTTYAAACTYNVTL